MAVVEKTFNCDPGVGADFHNIEECCGWTPPCDDSIIWHTYPFDEEYKIRSLTITTRFRKIYDSRMDVIVEFQIGGSWVQKAKYSNPWGSEMTQIIDFEPFKALAFRVRGEDVWGQLPLFAYTYGSLLVEEPSCEGYTNQIDCETAGCYWWPDGTCHSEPYIPPPPDEFPWIYVIIAGVGIVAIAALLKKKK